MIDCESDDERVRSHDLLGGLVVGEERVVEASHLAVGLEDDVLDSLPLVSLDDLVDGGHAEFLGHNLIALKEREEFHLVIMAIYDNLTCSTSLM